MYYVGEIYNGSLINKIDSLLKSFSTKVIMSHYIANPVISKNSDSQFQLEYKPLHDKCRTLGPAKNRLTLLSINSDQSLCCALHE